MRKGRLEAFSDGVIAIIITIMVLELKAPEQGESLGPLMPIFLSYVLSFIYVGIYWNNHHHMFAASQRVNGATLWANLHLLFWLSLIPFVTSWMGNSHFASAAVSAYGFVLLMCAGSWSLLAYILRKLHGPDAKISQALSRGGKEKLSLLLYLAGVIGAHWLPMTACVIYCAVAVMWFVPDLRFEEAMAGPEHMEGEG